MIECDKKKSKNHKYIISYTYLIDTYCTLGRLDAILPFGWT